MHTMNSWDVCRISLFDIFIEEISVYILRVDISLANVMILCLYLKHLTNEHTLITLPEFDGHSCFVYYFSSPFLLLPSKCYFIICLY